MYGKGRGVMRPEPVFLIFLVVLILCAFFATGDNDARHGVASDPEAARQKAQALKEAAIQAVIDAELKGAIDLRTRNSQIAYLS
jgi:hypothetical protein